MTILEKISPKLIKISLLLVVVIVFVEFSGFPLFTDFDVYLYYENITDMPRVEFKSDRFGEIAVSHSQPGFGFHGKIRINLIDRIILEYRLQRFKSMQPTKKDELTKEKIMRVNLIIDNKYHEPWRSTPPFSAKFDVQDEQSAEMAYCGSRELVELVTFLLSQDITPIMRKEGIADGEKNYFLYKWADEFRGKVKYKQLSGTHRQRDRSIVSAP